MLKIKQSFTELHKNIDLLRIYIIGFQMERKRVLKYLKKE